MIKIIFHVVITIDEKHAIKKTQKDTKAVDNMYIIQDSAELLHTDPSRNIRP